LHPPIRMVNRARQGLRSPSPERHLAGIEGKVRPERPQHASSASPRASISLSAVVPPVPATCRTRDSVKPLQRQTYTLPLLERASVGMDTVRGGIVVLGSQTPREQLPEQLWARV
jgi:hypothetical protein